MQERARSARRKAKITGSEGWRENTDKRGGRVGLGKGWRRERVRAKGRWAMEEESEKWYKEEVRRIEEELGEG